MRPTTVLIAIVAAGLALRLFDLGGESLWLDEGIAIRIASMPLAETVTATVGDVHPPLYRSLLHGWIRLFGSSETATRLLSALLGTLAVWLAGIVGVRICGPFVGLAAAALVAVSPLAIRYAQDATSYSLFLSLTLLSQLLFLRWLARQRLADGLAYALATTALLYAHNTACFVVLAQWITLLVALRSAPAGRGELFLRWIFLQISVAALYLPWISVLLRQLGHVREDFWTTVPTLRTLGGTLLDHAGSPWMLGALGLAVLAGAWATRTEEEPRAAWPSPRAVILPWLLVPLAGPFVASYLVAPIFLTRITLPALPALMLLAARGVARVRSAGGRAALASALLLGTAFPLVSMYREPNKERWREAAADIDAWASPGDLLLVHAPYCKIEVLDYYLRRRDLEVVPFPETHAAVADSDTSELRSWIAGRRRVWLVQSHSQDGKGLIRSTLTAALPRVTERDYPQVGYRWSPGPPYIGVALWRYEGEGAQAPGERGR